MLLEGLVLVVSGAGPGVGSAVAKAAAREGASVVAAARNKERLDEIVSDVEDIGGRAIGVATDVTSAADCHELASRTWEEFGRIDALVNSAFWTEPEQSLLETEESVWQQAFDVNVLGAWRLMKSVVPLMESGGSIVNVGSQAAYKPSDTLAIYAAVKSALVSLTRSAAKQFGANGVRVNGIMPGSIYGPGLKDWIETRAAERGTTVEDELEERLARSPLHRIVTPEEIAEVIVFTSSPKAGAMTGTFVDTDCGQHLNF